MADNDDVNYHRADTLRQNIVISMRRSRRCAPPAPDLLQLQRLKSAAAAARSYQFVEDQITPDIIA